MTNNLQIEIDSSLIQAEIEKTTAAAIKESCADWQVKEKIKESFKNSVLSELMAGSVNAALNAVDFQAISAVMAKELTASIISSTTLVFKESALGTIFELRGLGNYSDEDKAARKKLREEFEVSFQREKDSIKNDA